MSKYYKAFFVERIIKLKYAETDDCEVENTISELLDNILNLPTIDLVCCDECRHWSKEFHDCGIRDSYGWDYKPNDFVHTEKERNFYEHISR